jgi:hypothetical protein
VFKKQGLGWHFSPVMGTGQLGELHGQFKPPRFKKAMLKVPLFSQKLYIKDFPARLDCQKVYGITYNQ